MVQKPHADRCPRFAESVEYHKNGLAVGVLHANDYWNEGHVPAESITNLLNNAPEDVAGLAHLRAEIQSGDEFAWEVVTYDAEGESISSVPQVEQTETSEDPQ